MGFIYFSSQLSCPPRFENFPQTRRREGFLVFGNSLCYSSLPGTGLRAGLRPSLFCLSFHLLYFVPSPLEDDGLLLWAPGVRCQRSEAVFAVCSAFRCSFDEFVGEKVVSPSRSSTVLAPPPPKCSVLAIHVRCRAPHSPAPPQGGLTVPAPISRTRLVPLNPDSAFPTLSPGRPLAASRLCLDGSGNGSWSRAVFVLFYLAYFTGHHVLQVHPRGGLCQNFFPFVGWTILHCVYGPRLLIHHPSMATCVASTSQPL